MPDQPTLTVTVAQDGSVSGATEFGGQRVSVNIEPDDAEVSESIAFAQTLVSRLQAVVDEALRAAVRDLLAVYNSGWRHYDEVDDVGKTRSRSDRELSPDEFARRLRLTALNITGTTGCDLFFADDNLFWGHSVVVASSDAGATWVDAQLFG